ncbi:hypothetical protein K4F52_002247 [Lecanicillium sp. MT-2017a]|nr:hypothetical protein K4F52_002247 [Lecanicillium sp. MT-2017a]
MKWSLLSLVPLFAPLLTASPVHDVRAAPVDLPRLIVYFQTTHDSRTGRPISMLPLINEKGIALTHLIVCSLHINRDSVVHLNDYPPSDPRFYTLWNETVSMKNAGVKVMGMVGGAAAGSFDSTTLDGDEDTFEKYYGQLRDVIKNFGLEGMDLDVEQRMSQAGITRLVSHLRKDFGTDFTITLAPVASALFNGGNLSGFDYKTLQETNGDDIAFYNAQFYSGFGSMSSPRDYRRAVSNGFSPSKVVAGQLTSPSNGYGYIPYEKLNATVISLRDDYGQIGGVMGWEYFNSKPGDTAEPWKWAQIMTEILRPNSVPDMKITKPDADRLQQAYEDSLQHILGGALSGIGDLLDSLTDAIDYQSMVNA